MRHPKDSNFVHFGVLVNCTFHFRAEYVFAAAQNHAQEAGIVASGRRKPRAARLELPAAEHHRVEVPGRRGRGRAWCCLASS